MPLARACKETKRRNPTPLTGPRRRRSALPEPEDLHAKGERRRGTAGGPAISCCRHTNARGRQDACGTCPRPTRRRPSGASRGQPPRAGHPPRAGKQRAGKRPGPRRRRRPARAAPTTTGGGRVAGLIESAQHDAVRSPHHLLPCGQAARIARRRVVQAAGALRVNDDDPPPLRRRRGRWTRTPRRAVPKYRVSERRRENTLRDSLLPERPAPNADDGFMLGLMTAIGCGTISCGCGEEDIS